jgi:hypothetical protein
MCSKSTIKVMLSPLAKVGINIGVSGDQDADGTQPSCYFAAVIVASIRNLCNLCYNGCNSASSESEAPGPLAPTTKTPRSSGVAVNTLAMALPPTRSVAGLRTLSAFVEASVTS